MSRDVVMNLRTRDKRGTRAILAACSRWERLRVRLTSRARETLVAVAALLFFSPATYHAHCLIPLFNGCETVSSRAPLERSQYRDAKTAKRAMPHQTQSCTPLTPKSSRSFRCTKKRKSNGGQVGIPMLHSAARYPGMWDHTGSTLQNPPSRPHRPQMTACSAPSRSRTCS